MGKRTVRVAIGNMSGTSLDGIDVVLATIEKHGTQQGLVSPWPILYAKEIQAISRAVADPSQMGCLDTVWDGCLQ